MIRQLLPYGAIRHALLMAGAAMILLPFLVMAGFLLFTPPFVRVSGITIVDNVLRAVQVIPFARFMANGAGVAIAACGLQIATAAPCAYALAHHRFAFRRLLLGTVIVALAVPQEVTALPLFLGLNALGLADSYAALVLPFAVSPFAIFLLYQVFRTVPTVLIDAARLDGLSEASIVWRVMVPFSMPTIASIAILSVISRWNALFWPTIAATSQHLMPPVVGILYFRDSEAGDEYGALMAAALLTIAPLLVWFFLAQRRFIESLTLGAVK